MQDARPRRGDDPHKYIARKQRALQFHAAPILPLTGRSIERKKGLYLSHVEMFNDTFLPAGRRIGAYHRASFRGFAKADRVFG